MSCEITVNSIWLCIWLLPQCAMIFYLIEWYPMHYMLIANLQCVSIDIYVNADMIIIMNNDDLLNLLMIYSLK